MDADIFMTNTSLVEGRVGGECGGNVVGLGFLCNPLIDPMLGTGVEWRRSMGSSLCLVGVRTRCASIRVGMTQRSDVLLMFPN